MKTYDKLSRVGLIGLACWSSACFEPSMGAEPEPAGTEDDDGGGTSGESEGSSGSEGSSAEAESDDDRSTDEPDDSGTDTGGSDDGSMPEPTCVGARMCVSAVPEGWEGPMALREGDAAADIAPCGADGPYVELQFADGMSELVAPDHECSCSCDAGDVGCAGSTHVDVNVQQQSGVSPCGQPPPFEYSDSFAAAELQAVSIPITYGFGTTAPMSFAEPEGECEPVPAHTPTQAAFTKRTVACGTFEITQECGADAVCVPIPASPYDEHVCIWQEGDVECPADTGYTDRRVLHQGFEDTRGCSDCSCGEPEGECEGGSISFRGGCNPQAPGVLCSIFEGCVCPESPTFTIDELAACQAVSVLDFYQPCGGEACLMPPTSGTTLSGIEYDAGVVQGASCEPGGGHPVGAATPTDPITVCCAG